MTSFNQGNTATTAQVCSLQVSSLTIPISPSPRTSHYLHIYISRDVHFSRGEADDLILATLEELALESVSFKDTIREHKPLQGFWGQGRESTGAADWPAKRFSWGLSCVVSAKSSYIQVLSSVS